MSKKMNKAAMSASATAITKKIDAVCGAEKFEISEGVKFTPLGANLRLRAGEKGFRLNGGTKGLGVYKDAKGRVCWRFASIHFGPVRRKSDGKLIVLEGTLENAICRRWGLDESNAHDALFKVSIDLESIEIMKNDEGKVFKTEPRGGEEPETLYTARCRAVVVGDSYEPSENWAEFNSAWMKEEARASLRLAARSSPGGEIVEEG